jgi:hypothetical protein
MWSLMGARPPSRSCMRGSSDKARIEVASIGLSALVTIGKVATPPMSKSEQGSATARCYCDEQGRLSENEEESDEEANWLRSWRGHDEWARSRVRASRWLWRLRWLRWLWRLRWQWAQLPFRQKHCLPELWLWLSRLLSPRLRAVPLLVRPADLQKRATPASQNPQDRPRARTGRPAALHVSSSPRSGVRAPLRSTHAPRRLSGCWNRIESAQSEIPCAVCLPVDAGALRKLNSFCLKPGASPIRSRGRRKHP